MESLMWKHINLLVIFYNDLPLITIEEYTIDFIPKTKPVRCHQKKMLLTEGEILWKELDQLLDGGFIIPLQDAQWVLPISIVPKKNDKWRVCINFKALYKVTKKDRFRLSFIEELLDEYSGNKFFSLCDGYSRYYQVWLRKEAL